MLLLIASDEIWYIERGSFVFNGLISIQWALAEDDRKRGYRYVEPGLFAMHILFDANVLRRRRGLNFVDEERRMSSIFLLLIFGYCNLLILRQI